MKSELQKLIAEIEEVNNSISLLRPLNESLNSILQERLRIEWTYNSNAIEGNTLTFGETLFFLREGLTSEGRPLKDFLEARNHAEAINVLADIIREKRPITEFFIKSLHAVLLKGVESTVAKGMNGEYIQKKLHAGEYKKQPNHVLLADGSVHEYCDPLLVPDEMQKLMAWLGSKEAQNLSAIERAGFLHFKFVTIHPFDDGNGRISRLLMNVVLMQAGFPPCIIKNNHRKEYIGVLEKIRNGSETVESFLVFIAQELKETIIFMERVLKKEEVLSDPFRSINKTQRLEIVERTVEKKPLSISQIQEKIPSIKHATLKKDLRELLDSGKIQKTGQWKDVVYFK